MVDSNYCHVINVYVLNIRHGRNRGCVEWIDLVVEHGWSRRNRRQVSVLEWISIGQFVWQDSRKGVSEMTIRPVALRTRVASNRIPCVSACERRRPRMRRRRLAKSKGQSSKHKARGSCDRSASRARGFANRIADVHQAVYTSQCSNGAGGRISDRRPRILESNEVGHIVRQSIHLFQADLDTIRYDSGSFDPNASCRVLYIDGLLLNKCDGRVCHLVNGHVDHLLLHCCIDKNLGAALVLVIAVAIGKARLQTVVYILESVFVDLSNAGVEIVQSGEYNISFVTETRRKSRDVICATEEPLCLEMFEKGKIAATTGRVKIVSDERNSLSPMQRLVDRSHDREFSQSRGA